MKLNTSLLKQCPVKASFMAYRESGVPDAPAVIFLHGNPTSSYIWRNIIPHIAPVAHCIAPDLIGFGQSGKPTIAYRFIDHIEYLDAFLDALNIHSAYLVAQDWGTALAFQLAARKPAFVRGLAFMEFIRPLKHWQDFHQSDMARETFKKFRTPELGEKLIMQDNLFIERILPNSIVRKLGEDEMDAYRAPFPTVESRLPVWRLPNELPIEKTPADVNALLEMAHEALRVSTYPKLLFACDPGALVSPAYAREFAQKLKNCRVEILGKGYHYLQEDHPETIGKSIASWVAGCEASYQISNVA